MDSCTPLILQGNIFGHSWLVLVKTITMIMVNTPVLVSKVVNSLLISSNLLGMIISVKQDSQLITKALRFFTHLILYGMESSVVLLNNPVVMLLVFHGSIRLFHP